MQEGWYWVRATFYSGWTIAYFDGVWLREHSSTGSTGTIWREGYADGLPIHKGPLVEPKEASHA